MIATINKEWRDDVPIWKQIKERLLNSIIDGTFKEGEPVPSVRQLALDLRVNPLTVSRAFSELADDGILERRRGLGMFVAQGVSQEATLRERKSFLENEWPLIVKKINQLGLSKEDLINMSDIKND